METADDLLAHVAEITQSDDVQVNLAFIELAISFLTFAIYAYSESQPKEATLVTVDPELVSKLFDVFIIGVNVAPYMEIENGEETIEGKESSEDSEDDQDEG